MSVECRNEGLGSWIRRRATARPGAPALAFGSVRRTYAELADRIDGLARVLRDRGVSPGDRVAYQGPNHPLALESLFATTLLGAVWVPILPGRTPAEVEHIVDDAEMRLLIRGEGVDSAPVCAVLGSAAVESALAEADSNASVHAPVDLQDLAILGYTSGTTGRAKGTLLTHANLSWNVANVLSACSISARDVTLAVAPLTRMGGIGVLVLPTLFVGGTVVIPDRTDAAGVLDLIEREGVTLLFANPALLAALVADPAWATADLSRIRTALVGGNVVAESLLRAYLDRGVPLRHGYGLTEAAPVVTLLEEADAHRKFGSVGTPIGLVDVAVEGPDGVLLAPGGIGEVLVRGPNVTSGYWRRPDATAAAARGDGWWRTGDAGWLDAEGHLHVIDRMREAIRIGNGLVFPAQIESALDGHPDVTDVAAVGGSEGITLFVVSRAPASFDAARLQAHLRAALPPERVPSDIRAVDRIPRNAAGKILRDQLRARLHWRG